MSERKAGDSDCRGDRRTPNYQRPESQTWEYPVSHSWHFRRGQTYGPARLHNLQGCFLSQYRWMWPPNRRSSHFTRNAPSRMPGQTSFPTISRAASAIPGYGQTAVALRMHESQSQSELAGKRSRGQSIFQEIDVRLYFFASPELSSQQGKFGVSRLLDGLPDGIRLSALR